MCKKGVWELRTEESCSPLDHRCPTEVDIYYVVYSNEDAGGGAGETVRGAQEDVGAAGLEQCCPVPEESSSLDDEAGSRTRSLLLPKGLLQDALLILLLLVFRCAPGLFAGVVVVFWVLATALFLLPLGWTYRYLGCWHFAGLLQRLLTWPFLASLLSAALFWFGGQRLAGLDLLVFPSLQGRWKSNGWGV